MKTLKNVDKPFSEIFSLLKPAESESYVEDMKTIYQHISNVIDTILRGCHDLVDSVCCSCVKQKIGNDLCSFFSTIINLVEALNWFRDNICFSIRQQGICDY